MLLINTPVGGKIVIGDNNHYLILRRFNSVDSNSHCFCSLWQAAASGEKKMLADFKVEAGRFVEVLPNVLVTFKDHQMRGNKVTVTLGFDAPRYITIRGDWFGKATNTVLTALTDDELCRHVRSQSVTTNLEHELMTRLENRRRY